MQMQTADDLCLRFRISRPVHAPVDASPSARRAADWVQGACVAEACAVDHQLGQTQLEQGMSVECSVSPARLLDGARRSVALTFSGSLRPDFSFSTCQRSRTCWARGALLVAALRYPAPRSLQINQQCACLIGTKRPIIDTKNPRRRNGCDSLATQKGEQGGGTDRCGMSRTVLGPSLSPQCPADRK